jgi:hypothetical protein
MELSNNQGNKITIVQPTEEKVRNSQKELEKIVERQFLEAKDHKSKIVKALHQVHFQILHLLHKSVHHSLQSMCY